MMATEFSKIYRDKKVFITGHTGFKGSWLALWLTHLGARVYGYALEPPTDPSLFQLLNLEAIIDHQISDIRDSEQLRKSIARIKPDIIFHDPSQIRKFTLEQINMYQADDSKPVNTSIPKVMQY